MTQVTQVTHDGKAVNNLAFSLPMDKRESWWSLPCPMVDLSQVWSLLNTLKDRSQRQLFTGIVSAIWIICVSVGNIVGSSMLKTPCISIISFFVLRKFLSTKTSSSFEDRQFFIHYSFPRVCVHAWCVCVCVRAIKLQATDAQYWKTGANYVGNIL